MYLHVYLVPYGFGSIVIYMADDAIFYVSYTVL